jgi:hypothetical protein
MKIEINLKIVIVYGRYGRCTGGIGDLKRHLDVVTSLLYELSMCLLYRLPYKAYGLAAWPW